MFFFIKAHTKAVMSVYYPPFSSVCIIPNVTVMQLNSSRRRCLSKVLPHVLESSPVFCPLICMILGNNSRNHLTTHVFALSRDLRSRPVLQQDIPAFSEGFNTLHVPYSSLCGSLPAALCPCHREIHCLIRISQEHPSQKRPLS